MARTLIKNAGAPDTIVEQQVGSVGAVDNTKGPLADSDFPNTTDLHYWHLNGDSNDDGPATAVDFTTVNGTPTFASKGFFSRESVYTADGTNYYESDNTLFDPTTSFSLGGWVQYQGTNTGHYILSKSGFGGNRGYQIYLGNSETRFAYSKDSGSSLTTLTGNNFPSQPFEKGDWVHLAATYDDPSDTVRFYVNGQLAGEDTSVTSIFNSSEPMSLGSEINNTGTTAVLQDVFFHKGTALTPSEVNSIYSKRYDLTSTGKQIAAGHVLTADSFPYSDLTSKVYYWNLNSDSDDDSTNTKNLTNNNSIPFSGSNIFGQAGAAELNGTNQYFSSSDSAFENLGSKSWTTGGWFRTNWQNTSGNPALISNRGTNDYFDLFIDSPDNEVFARVFNTGGNTNLFIPYEFENGSWHHITISFDNATNILRLYFDGILVGELEGNGIDTTGVANFTIGSQEDPATNFFNGSCQDVFFVEDKLSDEDIRKLYSSQINLTTTIDPKEQKWEAHTEREDSHVETELSTGWLVDKRSDKIYVDLGGASGDKVTLKLRRDK